MISSINLCLWRYSVFIPWAPIFWFWIIVNIIVVFLHLPAKKYLENLSSIYDRNLFRLNVLQDPNPGDSLYNHRIHSRYYSPYSLYNLKLNFSVVSVIRASLFYIITWGVLSETLKTFKFIYWTSWILNLAL